VTEPTKQHAISLSPSVTGEATIDLRFPEAQWTHRQLQAQVQHAYELLDRAEAEAQLRVAAAAEAMEEPDLNQPLLDAHDLVAREWAATGRASSAQLAAADEEVARILATARDEARALHEEAALLRARPQPRGANGGLAPPSPDPRQFGTSCDE
jgi:hypothetical protein